jgi:hypothetical protein
MKHKWVEKTLWGRKSLKCEQCELHIVDYPMPTGVNLDGTSVRFQTSNVLSYDFTNKTKKQITDYAENNLNKNCSGVLDNWK